MARGDSWGSPNGKGSRRWHNDGAEANTQQDPVSGQGSATQAGCRQITPSRLRCQRPPRPFVLWLEPWALVHGPRPSRASAQRQRRFQRPGGRHGHCLLSSCSRCCCLAFSRQPRASAIRASRPCPCQCQCQCAHLAIPQARSWRPSHAPRPPSAAYPLALPRTPLVSRARQRVSPQVNTQADEPTNLHIWLHFPTGLLEGLPRGSNSPNRPASGLCWSAGQKAKPAPGLAKLGASSCTVV